MSIFQQNAYNIVVRDKVINDNKEKYNKCINIPKGKKSSVELNLNDWNNFYYPLIHTVIMANFFWTVCRLIQTILNHMVVSSWDMATILVQF